MTFKLQKKIKTFLPSEYQPTLNIKDFIVDKTESKRENTDSKLSSPIEEISLDVLFVGAGPAGLAGAIHLSQLIKESPLKGIQIGVLEKASSLGGHNLSGALLQPSPLKQLFPKLPLSEFPFRGGAFKKDNFYFLTKSRAYPLPTPPTMKNKGAYIASLSEVVRWMGGKAEDLGVNILTSCPAQALLMEENHVVGIRTSASGLNHKNQPTPNYLAPVDIRAKVTLLAEGSRGSLTQAYLEKQKISSPAPQIFSLGVKELWRTPNTLKTVIHTMNWPLPSLCFGGSFMYPMGKNLISLGLIAGLNSPYQDLDVHTQLQKLKNHPLFKSHLKGGEIEEWGAKTIPEGGFHSLPEKWHGNGVLILGDSAGLVNVPALKGIHYAMQSGIYAARSLFQAFQKEDFSETQLKSYDHTLRKSYVIQDLKKARNMRMAFKEGLWKGALKASFMILTGGRFPKAQGSCYTSDAKETRKLLLEASSKKSLSSSHKTSFHKNKNSLFVTHSEGVYLSKNKTRDDIPSHLRLMNPKATPEDVQNFYIRLCPARVYERNEKDEFIVNAPNCIDCKATDILGPRWNPREGGSGPNYRLM